MTVDEDSSFVWKPGENKSDNLVKVLLRLRQKGLEEGFKEEEIELLIKSEIEHIVPETRRFPKCYVFSGVFFMLILIIAILVGKRDFFANRCSLENNYIVMEVTRPITDCSMCRDVASFRIMENVSKEEFSKYAYLGQPMLVKGGCQNWTAVEVFSYDFFKKLYRETDGAFESVEEECQFFPFRTEFLNLQEVFDMPEKRAKLLESQEKTWYIGWSNCNPDISSVLRQHYSRPYFLPDDSELSAIDWIFMGYAGQGASMHLDYVQRPSWQAQIAGSKTWYLQPPPECEAICHPMHVTVHKGDIILVDTNQWYHTTYIEGKDMSITLGSEYD